MDANTKYIYELISRGKCERISAVEAFSRAVRLQPDNGYLSEDLIGQPVIKGFVGPMRDGERYLMPDGSCKHKWEMKNKNTDGMETVVAIRYETQEVYDILSR